MRSILIALLLAIVTLAGCSSDEPTVPDAVDGSGDDNGSDDGSDASIDNATNVAPTALLSASSNQTEAPVHVNFTLDGSDADGDNMTWTFDADGDGVSDAEGTELPAWHEFTFESEGLFIANLTVSDGKASTFQTLNVTVLAATAGGSDGPVVQDVSGEWLESVVSCPHTLAGVFEEATADQLATGSGISWVVFEIDAATWGGAWTLEGGAVETVTLELDFYSTAGAYMTYSIDGAGEIPADAGFGVVLPCGVGPGDFTYQGIGPA